MGLAVVYFNQNNKLNLSRESFKNAHTESFQQDYICYYSRSPGTKEEAKATGTKYKIPGAFLVKKKTNRRHCCNSEFSQTIHTSWTTQVVSLKIKEPTSARALLWSSAGPPFVIFPVCADGGDIERGHGCERTCAFTVRLRCASVFVLEKRRRPLVLLDKCRLPPRDL